MQLQFTDVQRVAVGAATIREDDTGFHFSAMTDGQLDAFLQLSKTLRQNAAATTGVRLDFVTNSRYVKYATLTDGKYEIAVDGMLSAPTTATASVEITVPLPNDGKAHRVTLHLPSHGTPGGLSYVLLEDGATLAPHVFDRRFLFIGDSITQGYNAQFDTLSYAYRVSDHFNAYSIIQGTGGAYYDASTLEKLDFDPDTVFVAYGTNDANRYKTLDEIRARCHAYLTKLIPYYENAKICVITPPWRVNEDELKPYGHVSLVADTIRAVAEELGLFVVDGSGLIPKNKTFMADNLHPNDLGFAMYAHNLIKILEQ